MVSMLSRGPITLVVAAIALFAVGGAAFTAANTTPNSSAGDDLTAVISGFTISAITYSLNAADPTLVDSVGFTAQSDHAGPWPASLGTAVGRFTTVATAWYVCTDDAAGAAAGTYGVTCSTNATGNFFDASLETQLTTTTAVEFDTVLVQ
jgi:hypothetical protein